MTDRLYLVGMMAVGKTTVGALCAQRLGCDFFDSDAQLIADTGRTAQEIFDVDGDDVLRKWESRVLADAVAHPGPLVVAVAGGAVLSTSNRELLGSGVVVWLRASIETMSARAARGEPRPRLGDDPDRSLRDLYRSRHSLYASVANLVIDVDELTPDEIVARIFAETGLRDAG
jgi:shikimate kinase